jgi:hypothetical protein
MKLGLSAVAAAINDGCNTYHSTIRAIVQCAAVRNHLIVNTLQHNARIESLLRARLRVAVMRAARRCYSSSAPVAQASDESYNRGRLSYNQECLWSTLETESFNYL